MRDLLANYRLIIRGKTTDSDSDQDPLMSSSSSSTGYGSSAEATIFKQDTSESEDETIRVTRPRDVEYGIESAPVSTLFPSNVPLHENTYDKLQYSNFDDFLYAREDMLPVAFLILCVSVLINHRLWHRIKKWNACSYS